MAEKKERVSEVFNRLISEIEAQEEPFVINDETTVEFYNFVTQAIRESRGVKANTDAAETINQETIARLENPDLLSPEHAVFEVFLRRLKTDPSSAWHYLIKEVTRKIEESAHTKIKLSEYGKMSGEARTTEITKLLREMAKKNPSISAAHAKRLLLSSEDVIVDGNQFTHIGDGSELLAHNLPSRLSKAKKWNNKFP